MITMSLTQRVITPVLQVQLLERENKRLKADAAKMRKKLGECDAHNRRITEAYGHAVTLAKWHCQGIEPSRRFAGKNNISHRKWQNANAMLRMARVLDRCRHWTTGDLNLIVEWLDRAWSDAIETPESFRARLNRHALNKSSGDVGTAR
jgi:hypothetical protein